MATFWIEERVAVALQALSEAPSYREGVAEVERRLGPRATPAAMERAFKRQGLSTPGSYVGTTANQDVQAPTIEQLARWMQAAAEQLDVEPRRLSRKEVCDNTPAQPAHFSAYGGFPKVRRDLFGDDDGSRADPAQKRAIDARRRYVAKLERQVGDVEFFGREVRKGLVEAFDREPVLRASAAPRPRKPEAGERALVAVVSDTHFGHDVDAREVPGNAVDWTVLSRRFAAYCEEVAGWKLRYRDETRLQVVLAGDIVAGRIHVDDSGIRQIVDQVHGASSILISGLDYLAEHFGAVDVFCVPGNHGRLTKERAFSQRWNNYSSLVFDAIGAAFRREGRVSIEAPLSGDGTFSLPGGELAYVAHGDVEPLIPNPGSSVDVKKLETAFTRLMISEEFPQTPRVWIAGHHHRPFFCDFGPAALVVNGCLNGADGFARNGAGFRRSTSRQVLFEAVEGHPLGDSRIIRLDEADGDEDLDKIVPPPALEIGRLP